MKKLIAVIFVLFSFQGLASNTINLTPIELCDQYLQGNSSLVLKKYKGQIIKSEGVLSVNYNEGNLYQKPFFTLSHKLTKDKNVFFVKGFITETEENSNKIINMDNQKNPLLVKIDEIKLDISFMGNRCIIYGELTNYE